MWPFLGGLVSGGASLLGSIFSSDTSAQNAQANIAAQQQAQASTQQFNSDEAAKTRQFSSDQADINRTFQSDQIEQQEAFQTQMSNTAYQRSRADMVKAGLNPILAASAGGASTPSGGAGSGSGVSAPSASVGTPNMALHNQSSPLAGLGDAASKVVSSAVQMKTFDKLTEEIANLQADESLTKAKDITERVRPSEVASRTGLTTAETRARLAELPVSEQRGVTAKSLESLPSWLRTSLDVGAYSGGKINDVLQPITNSASAFKRFMPSRSTSETTNDRGESSFTERFNY